MRVVPSCSSCNSFVAAIAIAITLMGCYGAAPMQMKEPQPATTATTTTPQADAAPPGELGLAK